MHKGIRFTQKPFLEPYIDYNTKKRMSATNDFTKDYFKLKNNALYGKTMEDVRKRMNYKLVMDPAKTDKIFNSPLLHSYDIITEALTGFKMFKSKVTLNKPIYIGQAVLEHSKLEMYRLYYNTWKTHPLIQQVELIGGDTDSFQLAVTVEKSITRNDVLTYLRPYFDSSNYPKDHPLYSTANKARLGCFKDECAGSDINEIIALKPKMYSIDFKESSKEIKRAKGISRCVVVKMKHKLYRKVLTRQMLTHVDMTVIGSQQHKVRTKTFTKRALSAWEDKRCWMSMNHSLPHGHPDTGIPPPKKRRLSLPPSGDVCD